MVRTIRTARLLAAAVAATCAAPALPAAASAASATPVIVNLVAGVDATSIASSVGAEADVLFEEAPNGFAANLTTAQLTKLQRLSSVTSIEPDPVVASLAGKAPPQPAQVIRAAQRRVGLLQSPSADIDGVDDHRMDVDIAIFDTGIDRKHPDLDVLGGVDCAEGRGYGDGDPEGHGTMVAGLAAAIDNRIGIAGTAPGARLWSVRIADAEGYIRNSSLRCGLEWLVHRTDRIEVANFSFGDGDPMVGPCGIVAGVVQDKLHNLTCRAVAGGVTVVAAAGNEASDVGLVSPGAWPEVITVSATAETDGIAGGFGPQPCLAGELDDHLATFSNFGPAVDIAAPGVCVTSTYPDGLYGYGSGTSFSTPFVSGAATLYVATHPGASPGAVRSALLGAAEPGPILGDVDGSPEGFLAIAGL